MAPHGRPPVGSPTSDGGTRLQRRRSPRPWPTRRRRSTGQQSARRFCATGAWSVGAVAIGKLEARRPRRRPLFAARGIPCHSEGRGEGRRAVPSCGMSVSTVYIVFRVFFVVVSRFSHSVRTSPYPTGHLTRSVGETRGSLAPQPPPTPGALQPCQSWGTAAAPARLLPPRRLAARHRAPPRPTAAPTAAGPPARPAGRPPPPPPAPVAARRQPPPPPSPSPPPPLVPPLPWPAEPPPPSSRHQPTGGGEPPPTAPPPPPAARRHPRRPAWLVPP